MIINLSDFLDNSSVKNSTAAFNAAAESLHDGDTLKLGGGKFDLYPDGAYIKHYFISNNDAGKKSIALPLIGKRDITIDGEGAELICHGELLPIVIDGCESVTIKISLLTTPILSTRRQRSSARTDIIRLSDSTMSSFSAMSSRRADCASRLRTAGKISPTVFSHSNFR